MKLLVKISAIQEYAHKWRFTASIGDGAKLETVFDVRAPEYSNMASIAVHHLSKIDHWSETQQAHMAHYVNTLCSQYSGQEFEVRFSPDKNGIFAWVDYVHVGDPVVADETAVGQYDQELASNFIEAFRDWVDENQPDLLALAKEVG